MCLSTKAHALDLALPLTAELVHGSDPVEGRHPIALGPWSSATGVPTEDATGQVQEFTWQISGEEITTDGLLTALQNQIEAQGYMTRFTCFAEACGGFDFRHALPVGQPPEMHIDLGDFHYLAAASEDGETQAALMISRGGATGFVHLALIQPVATAEEPVIQSTRAPDVAVSLTDPDALIAELIATGSAPLDDLQFETGASSLSGDSFASLAVLAMYLAENPDRRVVLVGHTDAAGSLSGNIALSLARATSVRDYLTGSLGVDPGQIEAQGIGFLSPRASNATAEGREANRRVEVVLAEPE
ncbi:OmpA family protein [Gymnodinialimonas ceratoperidinii]|uniref:OmpA family protein n=1 Tax=Gymnodinialimonas ceratoperidinii TaxID=2856823 RepID=A0A8F6TW76_9RHOB|nr:OmpA family protein [Gymnodinialimonas ceratoperidinii]QXT40076.1 OmpA family protein [Gymnodinialimonas ceratoperidinii]